MSKVQNSLSLMFQAWAHAYFVDNDPPKHAPPAVLLLKIPFDVFHRKYEHLFVELNLPSQGGQPWSSSFLAREFFDDDWKCDTEWINISETPLSERAKQCQKFLKTHQFTTVTLLLTIELINPSSNDHPFVKYFSNELLLIPLNFKFEIYRWIQAFEKEHFAAQLPLESSWSTNALLDIRKQLRKVPSSQISAFISAMYCFTVDRFLQLLFRQYFHLPSNNSSVVEQRLSSRFRWLAYVTYTSLFSSSIRSFRIATKEEEKIEYLHIEFQTPHQRMWKTTLQQLNKVEKIGASSECMDKIITSVTQSEEVCLQQCHQFLVYLTEIFWVLRTLSNQNCHNFGCTHDHETSALKSCNSCKMAFYCSKECQASDWELYHKHLCRKTVS